MKGINRSAGILLVLLCAGILISQVLVRPAVGIANNGNFPKIAGPLALAPPDGNWESHQFHEFLYQYTWAEPFRYRSGFWSSEYWFLKLARGIQRILRPGPQFDIRWLGGLHGIVLLFGVGLWVSAQDRLWRLLGGLGAILIWTDVAYVQYLNSMYTDAIAVVALILAAAAGLRVTRLRDRWGFALVMSAAAFWFAASKAQHALTALVFVPLFLGFAFGSAARHASCGVRHRSWWL